MQLHNFDIILGIAIGLAAGGSLLVVIIYVIIVACIKWRKPQRRIQDSRKPAKNRQLKKNYYKEKHISVSQQPDMVSSIKTY